MDRRTFFRRTLGALVASQLPVRNRGYGTYVAASTGPLVLRVVDSGSFAFGFTGFVPGKSAVEGQLLFRGYVQSPAPRLQRQLFGVGG